MGQGIMTLSPPGGTHQLWWMIALVASNGPRLPEFTLLCGLSQVDPGVGHLACFGRRDMSECEASRGLIRACTWDLSSQDDPSGNRTTMLLGSPDETTETQSSS